MIVASGIIAVYLIILIRFAAKSIPLPVLNKFHVIIPAITVSTVVLMVASYLTMPKEEEKTAAGNTRRFLENVFEINDAAASPLAIKGGLETDY